MKKAFILPIQAATLILAASASSAYADILQTIDGPITGQDIGALNEGLLVTTANDTDNWINDVVDGGQYFLGVDVTPISGEPTDATGNGYFFEFGVYGVAGSARVGNRWDGALFGFSPSGAQTTTPYVFGETYRMVMGIDIVSTGDDTVNFWLNPTASDLGNPDLTITNANLDTFDRVSVSAGGNDPNSTTYSNFIVATDFASVAVPEPSSAALLIGLSSLGLVARRRRS